MLAKVLGKEIRFEIKIEEAGICGVNLPDSSLFIGKSNN